MEGNPQTLAREALEFANILIAQYLARQALLLSLDFLEPTVTWIGTGADEIAGNLEEARQLLAQELREYAGELRLQEQRLQAQPLTDALCVVYGTLRAAPEDASLAEENLRISMVLQRGETGLRLVHLHASAPDEAQARGRYFVPKLARSEADSLRRALDSRSRQLANLTENIPGGVHQCKNDPNFTLLTMSDSFLTMFGYSRAEISQVFHDRYMEMIYPSDRAVVLKTVHDQLKQGPNIELEYRVMCKNGPPVWILDKGRLLDDGEGGTCFYCLLIEITDRKRQQEELRLSLERHQVIMDQATDIIFEWDIPRDTLQFSPNWRKKFGYDPISREISGRIPLSHNIHPEDMPNFVKIMQDTAAGAPYSETEFRIKAATGHYQWCRIRATAQFDADGRSIKAVGVISDIDVEKKQKQLLLDMAQKDALTGLYNKATIAMLVQERMQYQEPAVLQAMLILDVDHFKSVNDTYGHMAGDSVLSDVAAVLKNRVRESDLVGRIGGDEFLVFLSEVSDESAAATKAQRLRDALGRLSPEPGAPPITCSIGAAVFACGTMDYLSMYRYADRALYHQKSIGRDGVTVYDSERCADAGQTAERTAVGANVVSDEGNVADERLAQYCFRALYTARDAAATIDRLLEIVGRSFDVSRAYIFENSEDGTCCSNTFEWCADGVQPQLQGLQNIPYEALGNYQGNFNEHGVFYCPETRNTHPSVRAVLEAQNVCSMLQCAILDEGTFVGYVGFDECRENRKWTDRQVASFKLTADVLSSALVKLRLKQRLKARREPGGK